MEWIKCAVTDKEYEKLKKLKESIGVSWRRLMYIIGGIK